MGGTVKRAAALESFPQPASHQITNVTEMFDFLSEEFLTVVTFIFVPTAEVEKLLHS